MTIFQFVQLCWIAFVAYWMLSAGSAKPIQSTSGWLAGNWHSILLIIGFALMELPRLLPRLGLPLGLVGSTLFAQTLPWDIIIVILLIVGLVMAVSARRTLASNWSGQVAIKEGHELVTQGLYHYVRNPIYTGILLMALGTALAFDTLSALIGFAVVLLGIYFKVRGEERILAGHFGTQYASYKQNTKALIPFLW